MDLIGARIDVAVDSRADCTSARPGRRRACRNRKETRRRQCGQGSAATRGRLNYCPRSALIESFPCDGVRRPEEDFRSASFRPHAGLSTFATLWKSSIWRIQLVSGFHLGQIWASNLSNISSGCISTAECRRELSLLLNKTTRE